MGETEAPDGGYGWVVVMAAFVLTVITMGINLTFGILMIALVSDKEDGGFGLEEGTVAWLGEHLKH